ncbi:hypothetical protein [Amycolatopsis sp. NPDC059657]|uniref:hypothetical protein n=1 Tax=Amycolatopsis sp. NPDC059657 TaxID=3346899 RepID=UPI00367363C2
MREHETRKQDEDEELPPLRTPPLNTEVPSVPNRDVGTGGTKEVDDPPNTDDGVLPPS